MNLNFKYPDGLHPVWVPTIEPTCAKDAFLTKTLDEIYSSDDAPRLDTLFSFTPYVCLLNRVK